MMISTELEQVLNVILLTWCGKYRQTLATSNRQVYDNTTSTGIFNLCVVCLLPSSFPISFCGFCFYSIHFYYLHLCIKPCLIIIPVSSRNSSAALCEIFIEDPSAQLEICRRYCCQKACWLNLSLLLFSEEAAGSEGMKKSEEALSKVVILPDISWKEDKYVIIFTKGLIIYILHKYSIVF